ncbi:MULTISPECIES: hypothetical protein [Rufibacter]|uniref:Uncharacterized protein n=1 Tax=Rufibacter quisquiliarum TaxID=1549639 RepID=A0A839GSA8_9BACT|nr:MULTISPECIES: hypothetical protein [Rufibacter]MBA9077308.1 hypothetical protein [Rufibacter quisquiliarum]
MDFDISDFRRKLDQHRAKGGSAAEFIQQEIRKAEQVKEGISEETDHAADFVSEAINRVDTYVFQLQEIEQQCNPAELGLDQQTNLQDQEMRDRIGERLDRLQERGDANLSLEDPKLREGKPESGISPASF